MTKKQFVSQALEKIGTKRPLAAELKKMASMDLLDNSAINAIAELFRQMANYMKNKVMKDKMLAIAAKIESMKNMELQDTIQDQKDAESLLLRL